MNIDYEIIGKRIKDLRISKKLTQENLAECLEVSSAYISRIERGTTKLNLETLVRISKYLNTSPSYILTGALKSSDDYLRNEITEMIQNCSPAKIKLITQLIKTIVEFKEID